MPRDSNGNFTLVAGNPVASGTRIDASWANTTLTDIAAAITDSLSREGEGGMNVPFTFDNGSEGAPSITFTSSQDTGMYLAAGGTTDVRITIDANDVFRVIAGGIEVEVDGIWEGVPHDTSTYIAQVQLDGAFKYVNPVATFDNIDKTDSEVFFGKGTRTNDEANASLDLADTALQAGDNVSDLVNDVSYATIYNIPFAEKDKVGGFTFELTDNDTTLNLYAE